MKGYHVFLKRGCRLYQARIKVGPKWESHPTGCITQAEALKVAKALWQKFNPQPVVAEEVERPVRPPRITLRKALLAEVDRYVKSHRTKRTAVTLQALEYLFEGLQEAAEKGIPDQKPSDYARAREFLVNSDRLEDGTRQMYAQKMRKFLCLLVKKGLNPSCVDELKNLPKARKSQEEASGEAFQRSHLRIMLEREKQASELVRLLFWLGASGGPQIADAAFLPLAAIDWETGRCKWRRVKSFAIIEFFALQPLLALLRERRERLGPDAVYVFPELIYLQEELPKADCNTVAMKEVPEEVVRRASQNGIKAFNPFLKQCGIKTPEITFKSFRKANISFWASIGIKLKTRMRMAGHRTLESHNRYDTPSEVEIKRARDITWRYLQSIQRGEEFFIPATPYDMYEALLHHWDKFPDLVRAAMRTDLNGSFQLLHDSLREAFETQKQHTERQFAEQQEFLNQRFGELADKLGWVDARLQYLLDSAGLALPEVPDLVAA